MAPPSVKPVMCAPCAAAWSRWLDYRTPPAQPSLVIVDNSVRGVMDHRRARAESTYALIRQQCDAIRKGCAEGRHQPVRENDA